MPALDNTVDEGERPLGRRAIVASAWAYGGKFGKSLLAFPITLLLVNQLTIEEYGSYNLFISILFFTSVLSNLGSLGVTQRYLPEFLQQGLIANARRTIAYCLTLRLVGGLVCVAMLLSYSGRLFAILNIPDAFVEYVPHLCILILAALLAQLLGDGVLGSLLNHQAVTTGQLISKLTQLVVVYLAFSQGYRFEGAISAWLISLVVVFGYYAICTFRSPALAKPKGDIAALPGKRMVRYGSFYVAAMFGTVLFDVAIDNFLIAHYLGNDAVGRYAFAVKVATLTMSLIPINLLTPIVVNVSIRKFSETQSTEDLATIFTQFNKYVFFLITPALAGMLILTDPIIRYIFDERYASVGSLVQIVLLFSVIRYYTYAFQTLVKPLELLHLNLYRYGCSALNLVLNLLLIPKWGILGAAVATGTTGLLNYAIINVLVRRHVSIRQDWPAIARMTVNVIGMAAVVGVGYASIQGLIGLIFVIFLGFAAYIGLSYVNPPFTIEESRWLRDALTSRAGGERSRHAV